MRNILTSEYHNLSLNFGERDFSAASERGEEMTKGDSLISSDRHKADELIQKAGEAMPYYENNGDWSEFNHVRAQLENMPSIHTFMIAGTQAEAKDIKVDLWSVKGNRYRQFCDYMNAHYSSLLNDREMRATACLLENVHQHVKEGVGFCVIKIIPGKYKQISVIDNGGGFYNCKKQKRLTVRDAVRFGRAYGSRYKSLGQALAISFGLWSDLATVETPCESAIITPEGTFKKIMRGLLKMAVCLLFAIGVDLATLMIREDMSATDIFIIISVFGIIMLWGRIKLIFGRKSRKRYFSDIKFRIKNKQRFGSIVNVYFCDTKGVRKWRRQMMRKLKISLQKRAKFLRINLRRNADLQY